MRTTGAVVYINLVVAIVLGFAGCKDKDKETAKDIAHSAKDKVVAAKDKVVELGGDLVEKAKTAMGELDKVYKSSAGYELAIDDPGSPADATNQAKLDAMPSIEVKGVRVGYEEDSSRSLKGVEYAKHFRAAWKRGDKIVRISFYTKESIDLVAFGKLLAMLIPAVETVLH